MIQIMAKFYEVLSHILNMNNCTILITIEKFDSCDFTKNILDKFFIQTSISVLKKNILLKNYFNLKMKRIMLEAFISKFNLYVYKMLDEIKEKLPPNYTQKIVHFLA